MSKDAGGEKTEKPTPKRLKEARKEGQVPRTPDLGGWAAVLGFTLVVGLAAKYELDALRKLMVASFKSAADPDVADAVNLLVSAGAHVLIVLVLLGAVVMLIGVAGALAQGGFYIASKAAKPNFNKLDLIKGAKRLFGPQTLWEGVKVLVKASVVAFIGYRAVNSMMPMLGGYMTLTDVLTYTGESVTSMMRTIAIACVLFAGADYAMKRRQIMKQIKMSKDEVKREHKQADGDPLVKAAIRSRQLAGSRQRMMADVPEADVVLVNPTHIAVALRYDPTKGAPRVVARGAGSVATRIREVAAEAGVPTVADVPLARTLYTSCQVGQEIPAELFAAVAHILAYVMSRKKDGALAPGLAPLLSPRAEEPLPDVSPATRRRARAAARAAGS